MYVVPQKTSHSSGSRSNRRQCVNDLILSQELKANSETEYEQKLQQTNT